MNFVSKLFFSKLNLLRDVRLLLPERKMIVRVERIFRNFIFIALSVAFAFAGTMTRADGPVTTVREYRRANEHKILKEFTDLLAIPNVASDPANLKRSAEAIMEMMKRRGLNPQLLDAEDPKTPPAIYGELRVPNAATTLIFYAHYDGQPVDARQWTASPPFQPTFRTNTLERGGAVVQMPVEGAAFNPEWRLYARSSSDDKAGVMAILSAVDALRATGQQPTANMKFFFEGEEEAGSPHLSQILKRHKNLLQSNAWIICDGPVHQSGRKEVVFGVRGVTSVDITVYGAKRPLHSGHYGNWAPNPAMLLAKLLASMKNDQGRVTIKGFYDDIEPLGDAELRAIAETPRVESDLQNELGIARPEGGGESLAELINLPSLNIDGMSSADVGAQARNVIPTTATATIDMRLVKGNDYRRQTERLTNHIREQGFYVTADEPTDEERRSHPLIARVVSKGGYNAERTRMDLPLSQSVVRAVQSVSDQPVVKMPTLGGSLPLSIFRETLNATTITVPIANYDNNQHAENENIRLQNLWDGIEIMAALMTMR